MKKIAEVLLRTFLRRYPLPTRLSLFGYLGRYAWLKDVLEELRPELFPAKRVVPETVVSEAIAPELDATILGILEGSEIRGRLGYYKAETYLGQRGNGHLFGAIETTSKRRVVIKEFLLPTAMFTKAEAYQRQNRFQQLAGIQLADGRFQDCRLIQPIEAIADTESYERCFLVTEEHDRSPTLRQHLQRSGVLPVQQVQDILSQILQSLDFLHKQKYTFPSGAIQNGMVHGNLSLDSLLWIEQPAQTFVYLCDLQLWEQLFDPTKAWQSTQATPDSVQQDLRAVGEIGAALLQGLEPNSTRSIEPHLKHLLDSLCTSKFDSAETARRELLQLMARSPDTLAPLAESTTQTPSSRHFSPLLLLSLLGLVTGAIVLIPRLQSKEARSVPIPPVSTCCLKEVSAIPAGDFTYTSVKRGTWWTVLQQRNLQQRGQNFTEALELAQPKLQLRYAPANSLDEVLQQVKSGTADFAVMPLMELPQELLAQEIAYDGLAAIVSFSYAKRDQGLPATLKGQLSLEQVRQLYEGQIHDWESLGGASLPVQRYASNNPEAIALFEQQVLKTRKLRTLPRIEPLSSLELLRQIIRDFEDSGVGSIGFTPLSEIWGQCSVYPLALSQTRQAPVQPLVLSNGREIDPETDLCSRKGAYSPDPTRFQTNTYPLSYPIVVIYPRDNRRSAMGKKFVELMRTVEGQQLLRAAGLVPLE